MYNRQQRTDNKSVPVLLFKLLYQQQTTASSGVQLFEIDRQAAVATLQATRESVGFRSEIYGVGTYGILSRPNPTANVHVWLSCCAC